LSYGSKNLNIKARDATTEMKCKRRAGHIWIDHKTNTEIERELNITPVLDKYRTTRKIGYNM
jgi:hypothetical protein